MNYYKIVDVGNFQVYNSKFLDYYYSNKNNFLPINSFWNPLKPECMSHCLDNNKEFAEGISKFGEIRQLAVLILYSDGSLHIDADYQRGVMARLNIPLLNCNESITAFYDPIKMKLYPNRLDAKSGTITWPAKLRKIIKPIDHIELIQPTILRTSSPHTVFCNSCEVPRISLTVSFRKDLISYLDAQ